MAVGTDVGEVAWVRLDKAGQPRCVELVRLDAGVQELLDFGLLEPSGPSSPQAGASQRAPQDALLMKAVVTTFEGELLLVSMGGNAPQRLRAPSGHILRLVPAVETLATFHFMEATQIVMLDGTSARLSSLRMQLQIPCLPLFLAQYSRSW